MANHKSTEKRIRQSDKKRVHNKYYERSARNAIKKLRHMAEKEAAAELYPKVSAMVDKLAKKNLIHKNKASNLKSSLSKYVNSL